MADREGRSRTRFTVEEKGKRALSPRSRRSCSRPRSRSRSSSEEGQRRDATWLRGEGSTGSVVVRERETEERQRANALRGQTTAVQTSPTNFVDGEDTLCIDKLTRIIVESTLDDGDESWMNYSILGASGAPSASINPIPQQNSENIAYCDAILETLAVQGLHYFRESGESNNKIPPEDKT